MVNSNGSKPRLAVVLFNLGGPDKTNAVRPFLKNLFADKRIIGLPNPFREMLARLISSRRYKGVIPLYEEMGGKSPILDNTISQGKALTALLEKEYEIEVFPCMRYWHPMTEEVVKQVKEFAPDKIVLLPLYPHYSTTTSESSIVEWHKYAGRHGLTSTTQTICCYPDNTGFVKSVADLLSKYHAQAKKEHPELTPRVLFSAHGLPKKTVKSKGDPYPVQIELTASNVVEALDFQLEDWKVTYQSRVGPLEWLTPYTDHEIEQAGKDGVPLIVIPIAFVSEHLETLVELDVEFKEIANEHNVPGYYRVPTPGDHPYFIAGLAELVQAAVRQENGSIRCSHDSPICPATHECRACPMRQLQAS